LLPEGGTAAVGTLVGVIAAEGEDITALTAGAGASAAPAAPAAEAPTERADGTPLIGLAGFRILYGTTSGNLDRTIQLDNPGLSRYVVENLVQGTWYFAMTAYDQAGLQSSPSPAVQANLH
jgi:pyruvate/2-oxoglutarate dehydrogenase complex dihydrolipoamide acyltransferase (E2) component